MNKLQKADLGQKMKTLLTSKSFGIVVAHKKLTFSQIDKIRRASLPSTTIIKIKNTIVAKALNGSIYENLSTGLSKENLFVFSDDPFDACKAAKALKTDVADVVILKAASVDNSAHELNYVESLAAIGSQQNLQSKLLNVISEVMRKFLRVLQAKIQKEEN